jgi:hypothetical protein
VTRGICALRCRIDKAGTDPQTGQTKQQQDATVANIPGPQIRRMEIADAALYREIRLEALAKFSGHLDTTRKGCRR